MDTALTASRQSATLEGLCCEPDPRYCCACAKVRNPTRSGFCLAGPIFGSSRVSVRFWWGLMEPVRATLFQVLSGRLPLEGGQLKRSGGVRVVYLPQDFRPSGSTVYALAYSMTPLHRAEQALSHTPPERAGRGMEPDP